MIRFFVPGQPVGKGRPRIGKVGQHARMFTPAKTANYEDTVRYAAHQAMGGRLPLCCATRVRLDIVLQIPASWSLRKQQRAADGMEHPTTKPDIDNIEKAIFDAINGVVWRDDVQVVSVDKRKRYGRAPGVTVEVEPIAEAQQPPLLLMTDQAYGEGPIERRSKPLPRAVLVAIRNFGDSVLASPGVAFFNSTAHKQLLMEIRLLVEAERMVPRGAAQPDLYAPAPPVHAVVTG